MFGLGTIRVKHIPPRIFHGIWGRARPLRFGGRSHPPWDERAREKEEELERGDEEEKPDEEEDTPYAGVDEESELVVGHGGEELGAH